MDMHTHRRKEQNSNYRNIWTNKKRKRKRKCINVENTRKRKMQTIPPKERKKDPKEQYIADIQKAITELKHKKYQVIILGDTNVNEKDKENKHTMEWKKQMQENKMHNIYMNYSGQTYNIRYTHGN